MPNFDLLTFGSITMDIFMPLEKDNLIKIDEDSEGNRQLRIPLGEKIQVRDSLIQCGGGSANTAIGFSKLGFKVAAFGVMGDQSYKGFLLHTLESHGVSTEYVTFAKNQLSSFSVILSSWEGERTVLHKRTNESEFDSRVLENTPECRAIYMGHVYSDDLLEALPKWKEAHPETQIFWNPGSTQFKKGFDHYLNLFPHINCLFINVEEAEHFTKIFAQKYNFSEANENLIGKTVQKYKPYISKSVCDVKKIAQKFLNAGVKKVVITDGSHGAQLFTKEAHLFTPSQDVHVVSTLGAGDAFAVGMVSATLKEESLEAQLLWGSFNSGSVIQKFGAQGGQLTLKEMNLLLK